MRTDNYVINEKQKKTILMIFIMLLACINIKSSTIHPNKYFSIKDTRIVNRVNECWFCLNLIDYGTKTYSFKECSESYIQSERFDVEYSKNKKIIKNQISNVIDSNYKIGTNSGVDLLILPANDYDGVFIISGSENVCLTNDLNIDPLTNLFIPCGDFFTNTENYVMYFDNLPFTQKTFFTGLVSLYKKGTNNLMDYSYIVSNVLANYPDLKFYVSTIGSTDDKLRYSITNNPFKINVPISANQYTLYSNYDTFPLNTSYFCIHPSSPRPIPNDKFYTPYSTGYRCKNVDGVTNNFSIDYDIDVLNRTQFYIINSTRGTYIDTSYFTNNSDIIFTHSITNVVYKYNVGTVPVTNFETRLHYGNYSTTVTLKPDINIDTFEGKTFLIDSCVYTKVSIPVREKANYVKFTFRNITNNTTISSTYLVNDSNISFYNSTNGQTYTYNVGSIPHSSFNLWLNFGSYTITSISIKQLIDYELKPGYNFNVNTYNSLEIYIELKDLKPIRWYKLNNSLHDEISGGNNINMRYGRYLWDADSPKSGPGWSNVSLRAYYKRREGLEWFERNGVNNETNPIVNSGLITNIHVDSWREDMTLQYKGYFFSRDYSGMYDFWTISDDDSYVWLDGNIIIDNGGEHPWVEKGASRFIAYGEYVPLYIRYSEREDLAGLRFFFASPWASKDTNSRGYLFYELNTEIFVPGMTFPNEYTVTIWVKPFENHNDYVFQFQSSGIPNNNFGVYFHSSNNIYFNFQNLHWNSNHSIQINQWMLIGFSIKENKKLHYFTNTSISPTLENMPNPSFFADRNLVGLNAGLNGVALNARYKDLRIYDRYFEQDRVNALYYS